MDTPGAGVLLLVLLGVLGLCLYFIPAMVANARSHPHQLAILIVNLLFGATVIGWVGSLVWALVTPREVDFSIPVRLHDGRTRGRGRLSWDSTTRLEPTLSAPDKTCPSCAETLRAAAVRCRFCGHDFMGYQRRIAS
jgi:hypothetical protein